MIDLDAMAHAVLLQARQIAATELRSWADRLESLSRSSPTAMDFAEVMDGGDGRGGSGPSFREQMMARAAELERLEPVNVARATYGASLRVTSEQLDTVAFAQHSGHVWSEGAWGCSICGQHAPASEFDQPLSPRCPGHPSARTVEVAGVPATPASGRFMASTRRSAREFCAERLRALRAEKKARMRQIHGIVRCESCERNIDTGVDAYRQFDDGAFCEACVEAMRAELDRDIRVTTDGERMPPQRLPDE